MKAFEFLIFGAFFKGRRAGFCGAHKKGGRPKVLLAITKPESRHRGFLQLSSTIFCTKVRNKKGEDLLNNVGFWLLEVALDRCLSLGR